MFPQITKERKFLEKLKGVLGSVKGYASLLALYAKAAKECGLTLEELLEFFK